MTKTKSKTSAKHTAPNRLTLTQAIPKEAANREFVKSLGKPNEAASNHVEVFLRIMDSLTSNRQSFNLSDCLYFAAPFSLPPNETRRLFEHWCSVMESLHKITVGESVYDEKLVIQV